LRHAAIVILCIFLAVLWSRLTSQRLEPTESGEAYSAFPADRMWIFDSDTDNSKMYEASSHHVTPDFIGLTCDGKRKGVYCSDELMRSVYGELRKFVSYMLSSEAVRAEVVESPEAAYKNVLSSKDSLFIKFDNELPDAAISAVYSGSSAELCNNYGAYIRCMVIFTDDEGKLSAYARDDGNNYSLYTEKNKTAGNIFNNTLLSEYNSNVDMCSFSFSYETKDIKTELRTCFDYPIVSSAVVSSYITVEQPITDFSENADNAFAQNSYLRPVLDSFNINPAITKSYTSDGNIVFADKNIALTISPLGDILYEAADGNLLVSQLIGGKKSGNSFGKMTEAASIFVSSLPTIFFGGQAELRLRQVIADAEDDIVYFKFSYYFDGIRIISACGEEPYITVGVCENEIVFVKLKSFYFGSDFNPRPSVIPFETFAQLISVGEETNNSEIFDVFLYYNLDYYGDWKLSEWAYERIGSSQDEITLS